MGRKRSDKEDKRHKPTPKKSTPVVVPNASVTCSRCGASVPGNSLGNPMAHYDARVPEAWKTRTYCK